MKKNLLFFISATLFLFLISNIYALTGSISPSKVILTGDIGSSYYRSITLRNTNSFPVDVEISTDSSDIILSSNKLSIGAGESYIYYYNVTITQLGNVNNVINFNFSAPGEGNLILTTTISLYGNPIEDRADATITAIVDNNNRPIQSGDNVIIKANITNSGTLKGDYVISVHQFTDFATLLEIENPNFTLNPGESDETIIHLKINPNIEGEKSLIIRASYNGTYKQKEIKLNITKRQYVDIAYLLKDSTRPETGFINAINELGLTYDLIDDSQIPYTDFSQYRMILIGNDNILNAPVNNYKSLIANPNYYSGWSSLKGSTTKLNVYNFNQNISITKDIPKNFYAYLSSDYIYYLNGIKYQTTAVSTTGDSTSDLSRFVVAIKENPRRVFFGITKSSKWTPESKELFKNSIKWIISGEDRDGDGYYTDTDCNDNNPNVWQNILAYVDYDKDGFGTGNLINVCSGYTLTPGYSLVAGDCNDNNSSINPKAIEIPYDYIDNSCRGFDLADKDNDGYCKSGYIILNPLQCNKETGIVGTDCDDDNELLFKSKILYKDNDKDGFGIGDPLTICTNNNIPEGYSLNNLDCNDNNSNINPNATELLDNIDQNCRSDPLVMVSEIPNIIWNEDQYYPGQIDLKNYIKDPDGNTLIFSIFSLSNDNIIIENNNGVLKFSSKQDWNGEAHVVFKAENMFNQTILSNSVLLKVNPVNDAPKIINIDNFKIELYEDFESKEIDLTPSMSDVDNSIDELYWKIESIKGKFNASINKNTLILKSYQDENCVDNSCYVYLKLTDPLGAFDKKTFFVNILPINDAPQFIKKIEDITWNQNTNLTINLKDYFYDVDNDSLVYTLIGNLFINYSVKNNIITLIPLFDWFGKEKITIKAEDSEYSVSSNEFNLNVLYVDKPPKFGELNCNREILEDTYYNCELVATDPENDTFVFSVVPSNFSNYKHLNCSIVNDTILEYVGEKDYYGEASCILRVTDKDGYQDYIFNVNITNVNDPPNFFKISPNLSTIRVLNNTNKIFSIVPYDSDTPLNNLIVNWKLDGENVSEGNNIYTFNKDIGNYTLIVSIFDGEFVSENIWNIFVRTTKDFSCSEMNGYICNDKEICKGSLISVYDTPNCCNIRCSEKPPEFKNIKRKTNTTNGIGLEISNINSEQEFFTGNIIPVSINVQNNDAKKDINFDIHAYLYDITREDIISEVQIDKKIDKLSSLTQRLDLTVDKNINENNDFAIFVYAYGKEKNIEYYNEKYVKVKIKRKSHDISFDSYELEPLNVVCGDPIFLKIKLKNFGLSDEKVTLSIENPVLKINQRTGEILIEKYGSGDDVFTKSFNIILPDSANIGEYKIKTTILYNEGLNSDYIETSINIEDCKKQNFTDNVFKPSKIIKINNVSQLKQKKYSYNINKNIVIVISSLFTFMIMILMLITLKKIHKNRLKEKNKITPIVLKNKVFKKIKDSNKFKKIKKRIKNKKK
ncbi:MAG: MopE-related protein [Candidatus Pacearchaeota archaeon]